MREKIDAAEEGAAAAAVRGHAQTFARPLRRFRPAYSRPNSHERVATTRSRQSVATREAKLPQSSPQSRSNRPLQLFRRQSFFCLSNL